MKQWILITGGTKGIGQAVARCLAKAGYPLLLTYHADQAAAETVSRSLQETYGVEVKTLCLARICLAISTLSKTLS